MKYLRKPTNPLVYYLILTLTFFLLLAFLPANKTVMAMYDLTATEYRLLSFFVYLPLAAIWFAAFFGYKKLQAYARSVKGTPEGLGYEGLARGFMWLAWGLTVPTIIALVLNVIASHHPGFLPTAIISVNYLNVLFPLIAFSVLGNATHRLVSRRDDGASLVANKKILFVFVALSIIYCYLIFRHLEGAALNSNDNPYHLPVWMILMTIVLPYLYAWFIGLLAAYDVSRLARRVNGVLYQQALRLVSGGVTLVIASLISVQYLRSVVPRSGHLSLNLMLVTICLIYVVMMLGFVLITLGANRLKKIEDI